MTGADLECRTCGAGPVDVAPDYVLDGGPDGLVHITGWAVSWTCINGHTQITGGGSLASPSVETER